MLGFMKDDTEVGYYTAAVKVKTILVSFITSASVVLLPRASLYIEKGAKDEFYRILNKTLRLILLMAIPLAIYFIMYAEESILLLSGKEFIDSILPMQIIMPTLIFIGMTNLIGIQMLVPLGKEMLVFWSEVAGAIIDLILNAILIPSYGAAGAAVGTLVAEIAVLTLQIIFVRDKVRNLFKNVSWVKMFMANFLAILVSFWVMVMGWGTFITLLLSALMYFVMYGASLLLLKESLIREILTKKKTKI